MAYQLWRTELLDRSWLTGQQIAKYFAIEQEEVSALRIHCGLAERKYGPPSRSAEDASVGEQVSEKLPSHSLLKLTIESPHPGLLHTCCRDRRVDVRKNASHYQCKASCAGTGN
jgi:hypothetical protein